MKRSEWPRSKTAVRVVDRGPLDDDGRCSFTLLWWQDGRHRAQCFFAKPEETRRMVLRNIRWSMEIDAHNKAGRKVSASYVRSQKGGLA